MKSLNRNVLGHLKRYRNYYHPGYKEMMDGLVSVLIEIAEDEKGRAKGKRKTRQNKMKKAVRQKRGNVVFLSGHPE